MAAGSGSVLVYADSDQKSLAELLLRFRLRIAKTPANNPIPGSFWGDSEAGLIKNYLLLRDDTPLHSVLHEACHYICMTPSRRASLHTGAGSDDAEENAVCYLQIILADYLPGFGRQRMWQDMDAWGYSFRLGSARAWFSRDAEDARRWLIRYRLIDQQEKPGWRLREF